MASSTETSSTGSANGSDLFVGFPSVSARQIHRQNHDQNEKQDQFLDIRSVRSDGSTSSKVSNNSRRSSRSAPPISDEISKKSRRSRRSAPPISDEMSNTSRRSNRSAPPIANETPNTSFRSNSQAPPTTNEINHTNDNMNMNLRTFSFTSISTKADSRIRSPYDIDTNGVRIGPPSESSYDDDDDEDESTDQTTHTSSNGSSRRRLSNISRSSQKPLEHSGTLSLTANSLSQDTSSKLSKNLEGDFMGWGCASESTCSDHNSVRSGKCNSGSGSVAPRTDVMYEAFPERPRGDNLSACSKPRSLQGIQIEDEFDSARPWRRVDVEPAKEESARSMSEASSNGTPLSLGDGSSRQGSYRTNCFGEVDRFRSSNIDLQTIDTHTRDYTPSDSSYTSDGMESSSTITEMRVAKDALYQTQYNRPDFGYASSDSVSESTHSLPSEGIRMEPLDFPSHSASVRRKEPFRPGPPLSLEDTDLQGSDHSVSSQGSRRSRRSDDGSHSNRLRSRGSDDGSHRNRSRSGSDDGSHSNRSNLRGSDDGSHSNRSRGSDDGSRSNKSSSRVDDRSCSENTSSRDDDGMSQLSSKVALDTRSMTSKSTEGDYPHDENNQNVSVSSLFDNSVDSDPHESTSGLDSGKVKKNSLRHRSTNEHMPQLDELKPYNDNEACKMVTPQPDLENDGFMNDIARAKLCAEERNILMERNSNSQHENFTEEQLETSGASVVTYTKFSGGRYSCTTKILMGLVVAIILCVIAYIIKIAQ